MARPILKGLHPIVQIIFIVLLSFISVIAVTLVTFLGALLFYPVSEVWGVFTGTIENIPLMKANQIASSIGLFILPALFAGWYLSANTKQFLRLEASKNVNLLSLLFVALMTFALMPLVDFTGYWNLQMSLPDSLSGVEDWMRNMEEVGKVITEKFTKVETIWGLLINIVMIGILPALGEEMMFRGAMQPIIQKAVKNVHVAVWLTAIIFSAFHLQFFGFVPRLLLGAFMGYLLVWSGSLWLPIFAHFLNNTLGVILFYFFHKGIIENDPSQLGTQTELWTVVLSLAIMSVLIFSFQKKVLKPSV